MIRRWILGLVLCSALAGALELPDIARVLQAHAQVAGNFTQRRYLRGMTVPITATGTFRFDKNGQLNWKMEKPFVSELHISSDGIEQTYGDNRIPAAGSTGMNQAQVKLLLALLQGRVSVLQTYFDVSAQGTARVWVLHLVPKTALLQQIFRDIDVAGDKYVQQVALHEAQGDSTVIDFSQQRDLP